jgi:acyl-CoA ligase (AMP-forming) (exosortase A-associated)
VTGLSDFLRLAADKSPEQTALVHKASSYTYSEVLQQVECLAAGFVARGIVVGDRVAIWLPKQLEMVVSLWACAEAGAVFIPVNPALKPAQVRHILVDSGARLLVTSTQRQSALQDAGGLDTIDISVVTVETDWQSLCETEKEKRGLKLQGVGSDNELAAILYTSGSTGKPKGVMLSHRNLMLGADSVSQYLELSREDRILCVLPLSFDAGLNQLLSCFKVGATAVLLDHLFARDVVQAVERHAITGLGVVPPLWIQLADLDLAPAAQTLRFISNTGGKMPKPVLEKLRTKLPDTKVYLMYGLTEAFRSTFLDPALVDEIPDSVGKAIPHAEVRVLRKDGTETAVGEVGELVHAGPLVAQGYWQDAGRTAERFKRAPQCFSATLIGTPAVYSGDSFTRDENGFLFFVGRDDEMIKTSGYRVSPSEIEEAFYATGDVIEVAVTGVPDDKLGAAIVAAAVLKAGAELVAVKAKIRDMLPAFMHPKQIEVWTTLPRSPNGKLDRVEIARHLRASAEGALE